MSHVGHGPLNNLSIFSIKKESQKRCKCHFLVLSFLRQLSCKSRATEQIRKLLCFQNKSELPSSQVIHCNKLARKKHSRPLVLYFKQVFQI